MIAKSVSIKGQGGKFGRCAVAALFNRVIRTF